MSKKLKITKTLNQYTLDQLSTLYGGTPNSWQKPLDQYLKFCSLCPKQWAGGDTFDLNHTLTIKTMLKYNIKIPNDLNILKTLTHFLEDLWLNPGCPESVSLIHNAKPAIGYEKPFYESVLLFLKLAESVQNKNKNKK